MPKAGPDNMQMHENRPKTEFNVKCPHSSSMRVISFGVSEKPGSIIILALYLNNDRKH